MSNKILKKIDYNDELYSLVDDEARQSIEELNGKAAIVINLDNLTPATAFYDIFELGPERVVIDDGDGLSDHNYHYFANSTIVSFNDSPKILTYIGMGDESAITILSDGVEWHEGVPTPVEGRIEIMPALNQREKVINKVSAFQSVPDDQHFPTEKLVYDALLNKQNKIDSDLATTDKQIVSAINEVNSIAKGASKAKAFTDYQALIEYLKDNSSEKLPVGQSLYIVKLEVPDLWVYKNDEEYYEYEYTTDNDFIEELKLYGFVHVGTYFISALETLKMDVDGFESKSNKVTSIDSSMVTDTNKYPTAGAVYSLVDSAVTQIAAELSALRGDNV